MEEMKKALEAKIRCKLGSYLIFNDLADFNAVLAGGAITSLFTGNKINDYDIYFKNMNDYSKAYDFITNEAEMEIVHSSSNAVTFKKGNITIQLIRAIELMHENINNIINGFDFTINMAAYDLKEKKLYTKKEFFEDNIKRELVFNIDTKYPIVSLHRAVKYMNRGYKFSGYEQVKIAICINKLVIKDYKDLKRQLLGIDTSVFAPITEKLLDDPIFDHDTFLLEMEYEAEGGEIVEPVDNDNDNDLGGMF